MLNRIWELICKILEQDEKRSFMHLMPSAPKEKEAAKIDKELLKAIAQTLEALLE